MKTQFCHRARTANSSTHAVTDTHAIIACAVDALKHNETALIEVPLNPAQLRFVLKKILKKARVNPADCAVDCAVRDDGYTQFVEIKKLEKQGVAA